MPQDGAAPAIMSFSATVKTFSTLSRMIGQVLSPMLVRRPSAIVSMWPRREARSEFGGRKDSRRREKTSQAPHPALAALTRVGIQEHPLALGHGTRAVVRLCRLGGKDADLGALALGVAEGKKYGEDGLSLLSTHRLERGAYLDGEANAGEQPAAANRDDDGIEIFNLERRGAGTEVLT